MNEITRGIEKKNRNKNSFYFNKNCAGAKKEGDDMACKGKGKGGKKGKGK